mmetsp:Transcript_26199/g.61131  ORF Transcript_26199/g.61131 Transcript_26199/m.61131 type:complete len:87 (-) Transcript_26199:134-394(-)
MLLKLAKGWRMMQPKILTATATPKARKKMRLEELAAVRDKPEAFESTASLGAFPLQLSICQQQQLHASLRRSETNQTGLSPQRYIV